MAERSEEQKEQPDSSQSAGEQFGKMIALEAFKKQCPYWQECRRAQKILSGELEPVVCGGVEDSDCVQAYLKHFTGSEADYP